MSQIRGYNNIVKKCLLGILLTLFLLVYSFAFGDACSIYLLNSRQNFKTNPIDSTTGFSWPVQGIRLKRAHLYKVNGKKYTAIRKLGSGVEGNAYLAVDSANRLVVIKNVKKENINKFNKQLDLNEQTPQEYVSSLLERENYFIKSGLNIAKFIDYEFSKNSILFVKEYIPGIGVGRGMNAFHFAHPSKFTQKLWSELVQKYTDPEINKILSVEKSSKFKKWAKEHGISDFIDLPDLNMFYFEGKIYLVDF